MKFHATAPIALACLALASFASAQTPAPTASSAAAPTSYVRAKESGAKLKNLPDTKGETVLSAPAGTMMAVHSDRAGWLEVEPAGGMRVWVHGSFLKSTDARGVAEVTAHSVRMRPLPSSDEKSFPLPMKLDQGDRVRVIARADATKPLAEDWVQIWSPPGARAWVAAAETAPLPAGQDARAAWASATKEAQAAMPIVELAGFAGAAAAGASSANASSGAKVGASKPTAAAATEAAAKKPEPKAAAAAGLLADADKKMTAARAAVNPDFTSAKSAYQAVIAESPTGASAETAHARLDEIAIREEMQKLKVDRENYEKQRADKLSDAEAKLREVAKKQDPLQGRFQARGWLEKEIKPGVLPRYVVRWAGNEIAEIICASGRYDLDRYVGSEIGVLGVTQRAAVAGTDEAPGSPARIDATRIEVISTKLRG